MNFPRQGFRKLLSERPTDIYNNRQTESTDIINHAASLVVCKNVQKRIKNVKNVKNVTRIKKNLCKR